MKRLFLSFMLGSLLPAGLMAQTQKGNFQKGDYGYLFCHMNDHGRAWTAYALSRDGFHYHDLLNGDSIFSDFEHARIEGATRDAYICRKHDGTGYLMVCTDMNVGRFKDLKKKADTVRVRPSSATLQLPPSIRIGRLSIACGHRR